MNVNGTDWATAEVDVAGVPREGGPIALVCVRGLLSAVTR